MLFAMHQYHMPAIIKERMLNLLKQQWQEQHAQWEDDLPGCEQCAYKSVLSQVPGREGQMVCDDCMERIVEFMEEARCGCGESDCDVCESFAEMDACRTIDLAREVDLRQRL